jgi:hypothetical protein
MTIKFVLSACGAVADERQGEEHVRDRLRSKPTSGEARKGRRQPGINVFKNLFFFLVIGAPEK